MTTRPNLEITTGSQGTLGQAAADHFNQHTNYLSQLMGAGVGPTLTISSGAITPTMAYHRIDTQGQASSDALTSIQPSQIDNGHVLVIQTTDDGRSVDVVHGSGNIRIQDNVSFALTNVDAFLMLVWNGATWVEIGRGYGSDKTAARLNMGLGESAGWNEATTAEAQAGTRGDVVMTPRRAASTVAAPALMVDNRSSVTALSDSDLLLVRTSSGLRKITASDAFQFSKPWQSGQINISSATSGTVSISGNGAFSGLPSSWSWGMQCVSSSGNTAGFGVGELVDGAAFEGSIGISWKSGQLRWHRDSTPVVRQASGGFAPSNFQLSSFRLVASAFG